MEPRQTFREVENLRFRFQMNNRLRLECLAAVSKVFRDFEEPIADDLLASVVFALPQELVSANGNGHAYATVGQQVAAPPPNPPNPMPGNPPGEPMPGNPPGEPKPGNPPGEPKPGNPPGEPKPGNPPGEPKPGNPPGEPKPGNPPGEPKPGNPPGEPKPGNPPGQPKPK